MSLTGVILVITASFAVLGALFWLVGFAVGRGRRTGWVTTTGRWTRFESGFTRSWQVTYTTPEGSTHHVMPVMNATTLRPGGPVQVTYDPRRPERAVIDSFYHRGGALKVIGLVALGIAALGLVAAGVVAASA